MATKFETVGVTPVEDGIEVRFKFKGKTYRPRMPLKPTKANLLHAHRTRQEIMKHIGEGTFDMLEYFPNYKFAEKVKTEATAPERTFAEWVAVWAKLSERELEHSTLKIYKRHLAAYWTSAFGHLKVSQITHEHIMLHLAELATERTVNGKVHAGLSRKTQNNILIPLRGVFAMISRAPGAGADPTDGIENLRVQTGNPDPFTLDEVELALAQIKDKALADFFEFAAFAGLRVSEQIALLWSDVDLRTSTIVVRRAKVLTQVKERTKTSVEREVELNDRAAAVLQRQRARTQAMGKEVFLNTTTGKPWNDEQQQRVAWALALRSCGIRHRPPKELRDSSVTFSLQAGADPWYVAQQHGHSIQTMMKDYAKWIPNADRGRNRNRINQAICVAPAKDGTNDGSK